LREPKRFTILVRRGIDLAARGEEVRKLVCHGFSARIHASGLGFDDVMQHIMIKILSNNRGKGAWDPSRSSFSHYVYMVTGCVLSNLEGKARKRRSRERVGLVGYSDGESSGMDVGSLDRSLLMGTEALSERLKTSGARYGDLARRILPMVVKGHTRSEIAEQTGVKLYRVGRAMRDIRDVCKSGGGSSAGGASLPR
jgi:DNA-directed RNA polymerase specialized sigma24 family protein